MGQSAGKKKKMAPVEIPEAQLESYIRSEFRAMDDDHDGKINRQQTLDLLTLLGYADGKKKLLALHVKSEDEVELEDYVKAFKADKTLVNGTARMRGWFKYFDKNGDGTATKEEIISGLESVAITVDKELHATVDKMDANHDGKITYEEFLVTQFRISLTDKAKV